VSAAAQDAGVASGLANAYADLPIDARRRFVDAVVLDGEKDGAHVAATLATLLGVEPDPSLSLMIFQAMTSLDREGLEPSADQAAWWGGTLEAGAAAICRPLYSNFIELVMLGWDTEGVRWTRFEPLTHEHEIDGHFARSPALGLEVASFRETLDRVAEVIWRHIRRTGTAPESADLLRALF